MGSGSSKDADSRGRTDSSRRQNLQKEGAREGPNRRREENQSTINENGRRVENDATRNNEHYNGKNASNNYQNNSSFPQSRSNNNSNQREDVSHKKTMVEFVDSSEENDFSDTDSILGVDISDHKNRTGPLTPKKRDNSRNQQGSDVKRLGLMLPPPPPSQQNHSVVFEQERALNEYNRQHGYTTSGNTVLKHPQISRLQQQNFADEENFPESYAQRLQRDQYRRDYSALLREKTIYRNPDDWELEESIVQTFDAARFKEANKNKPPPQAPGQQQQSLYEPATSYGDTRGNQSYADNHQYLPTKRKGGPAYDDYDEQLMADIEKEFEL